MTDATHAPRDDLYRAMQGGITSEDGKTLTIRLAPHDQWAEIQSVTEGHFMERFAKSAYRKTMDNRKPKILFNHGKDPEIGEKPIATTDEVGEDATSPFARGQILDGVPELVRSGLTAGVYGASHRFSVVRETWNDNPPKNLPHNPKGLPERTITEAQLFELGPVTWPAYAQASVSLRSMTDEMRPPSPTPEAPSLDAAAPEPHLEPERRDDPAPIAAPVKENRTVEYVTREEKASRATELKQALTRQATEYPGVLPAEAQATWDADTAELETIERDIAAWDSRQARLAAYANDETKTDRFQAPTFNVVRKIDDIYDLAAMRSAGSEEKRDQLYRDNAMRAVETTSIPHPKADQDGGKAAVANLLDYGDSPDKELARRILATGSPAYRKAFNRYFATGRMEERYAAVTTGGTTTGGYATPWMMDPSLIGIGAHTSTNPFRAACRVVPLVGTNKWEAITATAVLSAYAGEAVAPAEGGPTFGQPTYECLKASSFVTLSIEMSEDRPDMASEIAVLIQESKDTLEEEKFSIGAGTTVPWGVALLAEYTTTKTAGAGVVAIGDLYLLEAALPIRHRANAAWFMSRGTIRAVQGFETDGGILFNQPFATVGNPVRNATGNTGLQLLGYPVWEAPSISSTLTTPDTNPIVFCDPSSYIIVDRVGLSVEVIPHIFEHAAGSRPMGQRGVYGYWRNTARRVNVDAGRILVIE